MLNPDTLGSTDSQKRKYLQNRLYRMFCEGFRAGQATPVPPTVAETSQPAAEDAADGCDVYQRMAGEFLLDRGEITFLLYGLLYGAPTSGSESLATVERCRQALLAYGLVPCKEAKSVIFLRDVELLVQAGPAGFGGLEEEEFEQGETYEVQLVEVQPPPSSDMVRIVFKDGRSVLALCEDVRIGK